MGSTQPTLPIHDDPDEGEHDHSQTSLALGAISQE